MSMRRGMGGGGGGGWGLMRSFRRDESVTSQKLSPGILRRIARFAAPYRRMLLVFLVLIILDALLGAANPLIYRAIIDDGILTHDSDLVVRLAEDVILVADCLFAVVKPQADEREVSDTDFGRALSGDVIDQATTALLEELIDFFPKRRRAILRRAWETVKKVAAKLADQTERRARKALANPKLEQRLMARLSGGSAGPLPASSASPPAS